MAEGVKRLRECYGSAGLMAEGESWLRTGSARFEK